MRAPTSQGRPSARWSPVERTRFKEQTEAGLTGFRTIQVYPKEATAPPQRGFFLAQPIMSCLSNLQKCHSDCLSASGTTAASAGALNSESRTHMNPAPVAVVPTSRPGHFFFSVPITTPSSATLGTRVTNPPCLRKNSAPPWRGFLWPPPPVTAAACWNQSPRSECFLRKKVMSSAECLKVPLSTAFFSRNSGLFSRNQRPDGNCLVTEERRTNPQPRSPGRGFSFCVASQSAAAGRDDRQVGVARGSC
jgi:hypothetical protein